MATDDSDALRAKLQTLFGAELTIERELGRGGMAAVFAAFDPALQRKVAIKMLLPELADDSEVADRFLREGRTMASLRHPHVTTVYSVRSASGTNAIVMQFVDGESLDAMLVKQPMLPLSAAGRILSQVTAGLQHAHDRGVVHRDVKPANVLMDKSGDALVSDFGIARRDDGFTQTKTGMVLGTSDYMSPEQRSGERVSAATDQYALGVLAFVTLTGRLPFIGTMVNVIRGHMLEKPPSLCVLRPEIPIEIDAVVQRMLAKAPEERWPSLADAASAFAALDTTTQPMPVMKLTPVMVGAITTPTSTAATSAATVPTRVSTSVSAQPLMTVSTAPSSATSVPRSAPPTRNRTVFLGLSGLAAVALLAVVYWPQTQSPEPNSRDAQHSSQQTDSKPTVSVQVDSVTKEGSRTAAAPAPARASATPGTVSPAGDSLARPQTPPRAPQITQRAAQSTTLPTHQDGARDGSTPPGTSASSAPAASVSATTPVSPPASASRAVGANLDDARTVSNAFVTLLNHQQYRDVAKLTAIGGDAVTRAELIKLTNTAKDFAVGFERLASAPEAWSGGFQTECLLDAEWRGGKKTFRVMLYASKIDNEWHVVGFGVQTEL